MDFGYHRLYINGELRDASTGAREEQICPGTAEPVADLAWASVDDAAAALEAARDAFPVWAALPLEQRAEWMSTLRDAVIARGDDLRSAVMHEMGKPWAATDEDLQSLCDSLEYYPKAMGEVRDVSLADDDASFSHRMVSRPIGVVVAILAWNFPLLNIGFKLGPALAAGCSIIIKPSERSALSAYVLGEIAQSIGFPAGVINILCGPPKQIGTALSTSSVPRLLTMIGSSAVGRALVAQGASTIKRMSMELGGNAPAIVFEDADLVGAAREIAAIKFGNAGQICVSPNRIFVQKKVLTRFLELLRVEASAVKLGFGKDSGATMGPVITAEARERIHGLLREAVSQGAELVQGGGQPAGPGYFLEPTILSGVRPEMRISREETFGPVASVHAFETEEEVLREANNTVYGLVAYAYTGDPARAGRLANALEFGEVMLNGFRWGIHLPHGGIKESGVGKDCSTMALDDYLVKVRITTRRGAAA